MPRRELPSPSPPAPQPPAPPDDKCSALSPDDMHAFTRLHDESGYWSGTRNDLHTPAAIVRGVVADCPDPNLSPSPQLPAGTVFSPPAYGEGCGGGDGSGGGAMVSRADFSRALEEVRPAAGAVGEALRRSLGRGLVEYGSRFRAALSTASALARRVSDGEGGRRLALLLHGPPGAGKSAVAARVALDAGVGACPPACSRCNERP